MPRRFQPLRKPSTFRRMAASMWRKPGDPTIYGYVDVEVSHTLSLIEQARATGQPVSLTHVVAKAVADAFAEYPDLNAKVRFGGRIDRRETVDLFVSVATGGGRDLSGVRVDQADQLTVAQMATAMAERVAQTRSGNDPTYRRSRNTVGKLPWWLLRPMLSLTDILTNELHLHRPSWGMPADPFGSAIITNVGMFGIDTAFAPLLPMARCPMLVLITEAKQRPWVVGDRVEPRPVLRLCASFDHRIIDGYQAGLLAQSIRRSVETPNLEIATWKASTSSSPSMATA